MVALQLLDRREQMGPPSAARYQVGSPPDAYLGSKTLQLVPGTSIELTMRSASRSVPRVAVLRIKHFRPQGREERIARSLAALDRRTTIELDAETWRWIAEDADVEYIGLE